MDCVDRGLMLVDDVVLTWRPRGCARPDRRAVAVDWDGARRPGGCARTRLDDHAEARCGRAGGAASINSYFGTANVHADGAIAWPAPFGSTRMAGPPELMDQEAAYLEALARTERWRLDGAGLVLESADGRTRLTFSMQ